MRNVEWFPGFVKADPPAHPLKITGTRFAAILGRSRWKTPFAEWCEITHVYREPFVDTKYTIAGKVIEPKQADYMARGYAMTNLLRPADLYGADAYQTMKGDFFPDEPVFGGMWDYLLTDEDGKPDTVLEMKTTKRAEDWGEDIPEYYALQAALYAWLLNCDKVVMVCSFLDDADYDHPEDFVPGVDNTITRPFRVSERYPDFAVLLEEALDWFESHVLTGISPDYDEKADADTLKALRTNSPDADADLTDLLKEAAALKRDLDQRKAETQAAEKRYKAVTEAIRGRLMREFDADTDTVTTNADGMTFTVTRSTRDAIDEERMKEDGIYDRYLMPKTQYTMRVSAEKRG